MSKRYMSMILAGLALFLTACGSQTPETNSPDDPSEGADVQAELPTWLDRFYNGSYEYLNSTIDPETGTAVTVMSGKRISSPYTEYVKVVDSSRMEFIMKKQDFLKTGLPKSIYKKIKKEMKKNNRFLKVNDIKNLETSW